MLDETGRTTSESCRDTNATACASLLQSSSRHTRNPCLDTLGRNNLERSTAGTGDVACWDPCLCLSLAGGRCQIMPGSCGSRVNATLLVACPVYHIAILAVTHRSLHGTRSKLHTGQEQVMRSLLLRLQQPMYMYTRSPSFAPALWRAWSQ